MTKEQIYELKHKRGEAVAAAKGFLAQKNMDAYTDKMAEVDTFNAEIDASEKLLAEEGRFEDDEAGFVTLSAAQAKKKGEDGKMKRVDELRGTNEYARSFAKAMRTHAKVKDCQGVEGFNPLYKALNEGGGASSGEDGGFLVPVDFDHQILQLEKEYLDLATFFNLESVTTLTGFRVVADGAPKALPSVAELGTIPKEDQPQFKRLDYTVKKYADRVQISSELLEDNVAGLLQYVVGWFGPRYILTKNALLLALLKGLTKTVALTAGSEVKLLKKAMITQLNTAYSRNATLLTNQNGYAAMDGWEDKNGRSLLVPNPADPAVNRFMGRQVAYGDNDLIPDEESAIPLYVGCLKAVGTLFLSKGIELATTDVGGDAWATDSCELRAVCRMDAQSVNPLAAFKATIVAGT